MADVLVCRSRKEAFPLRGARRESRALAATGGRRVAQPTRNRGGNAVRGAYVRRGAGPPLAAWRGAGSSAATKAYSWCRRSGTASVSCCAVQCRRVGRQAKLSMSLSRDADAVRVGELVGAGDDDALALFQARHDFHGAEAAGPGLDRAAHGAGAFDHPGEAAAVL